ncbi:GlsB/YeaQ/YmgE family stress response membrane protein [Proteiniclasticum sp. QWL-01]|uniref:GlsB/YeaQ/YmgE family stress response membrane protein n=1 Tax=Proteiniclasticum sp. QWL-01 TaxID=3036945 RepID=UPI00220BE657|nr:GlsB/YeaQ/YmgE family stress response membrane protein [Proteiniclasticum sp. QWL-01]UUM12765.1 GlsB/YeaQ/YmgE family stress response membrane protein [Clostridiaceae bacterium HFYG-1003]WFF74317.1 GlsB/YeaQ/YmgE family stress response membrane protein [Proteiniclasticum sp. QWL-01]
MTWIYWIIFGALVGWIAGKITKTSRSMSTFQSVIIGIVGSAVGGFIGDFLGVGTVDGFNLGSIVLGVIGAIIVLWLVNRGTKRR